MKHPLEISNSYTLHRLLYTSRHIIEEDRLEGEVTDILATSVRNNAVVQVTGFLLTGQGWFLQALEGRAKDVMTTYGRILRDPRHTASSVIHSGPARSRAFPAWSMCAGRLSQIDRAIVNAVDQSSSLDPARLDRESALALLLRVVNVQAKASERARAAAAA